MPDYTLSDTPAPAGTATARPSPVLRNMIMVAEQYPGREMRIAAYSGKETARVLAAKLRSGERAGNGRPAGDWTFIYRPFQDAGKTSYGVWATFTPPAAPEQ